MNPLSALLGALGLPANRKQFAFRVAADSARGLMVKSFTGSDHGLSADYQFLVTLSSRGPVWPGEMIGQPAQLEWLGSETPVVTHGLISDFTWAGQVADGPEFVASLASPLFPLKLRRNNRVFLNTTVPQIIEEVLTGAELSCDFAWQIQGDYPVQDYTVQYHESDWEFLTRLAAHSGLFFRWESDEEQARLIFHDGLEQLPEVPGGELLYQVQSGTSRERETIFAFNARASLLTAAAELRDYNYRTPEILLDAPAASTSAVVGHGSAYRYGEHHKDLQQGQQVAKLRQQALDWQREVYLADSDCRAATPGGRITLSGHPDAQLNREYLILQVEHFGDQSAGLSYGGKQTAMTYRNQLTLIPFGTPYTPPLPEQRRIHGILSAKVESAGGQYAYLDEQGRYRIRLHFDDGQPPPGAASHPVRLGQTYSGENYGLHFPLHPGTEVALTCVNGDLDRPLLLGALPNPETLGPVTAANPSQNILRTFGGNELLLEDRKGQERIELFTRERKNLLNLDAKTGAHKIHLATTEGTMEVQAAKSLHLESGDTHSTTSGSDHIITVENQQQLATKKAGIDLQAATDIRMKAANNVDLTAEQQNIHLKAAKNVVLQAGEGMSVEVRNQNLTLRVTGGQLSIEAAKEINILGQGGGAITIGQSGGMVSIAQSGAVTIVSHTVNINGKSVNIQGSPNAQGGGGGGFALAQSTGNLGNPISGISFGHFRCKEATSTSLPNNPSGGSVSGAAAIVPATNPSLVRFKELEAKKQRLAERELLIQHGRAKTQNLSGKDKEKLQAATDRLELNNRAVERARLADDVYNAPGEKQPPIGWKRSSNNPKDLPPALKNVVWEDPDSGFRAAFYDSEIDGSKVLAFRGTANLEGWKNNLVQGLGFESAQYERAIMLASDIENVYPKGYEISGHSLGGGLTSAASIVTGARGFSFNGAGLHPNTIKDYGQVRSAGEKLIDAFLVKGEVLTSAQKPVINSVATPLGTAVRYLRQANPVSLYKATTGERPLNMQPVWVYSTVGEIHELPAVDVNGNSQSIFKAGPVTRHGMENVINGIEKQKTDDKNAIATALMSK